MFANPTTFVLGAGSSFEIGLPLGSQLIDLIARKLIYIRDTSNNIRVEGDEDIYQAIKTYCSENNKNIIDFVAAASKIRAAMTLATSIDDYVDTHEGDESIVLCAKLAIARTIIEKEMSSALYASRFRPPDNAQKTFVMPFFDVLQRSWYVNFFKTLNRNIRISNVEKIFENCSIVSFNYDRTIEQFLFQALRIWYDMPIAEAREIVCTLKVYHPYGTIGELDWQNDSDGIQFGGVPHYKELLTLANRIRTYTESVESADVSDGIQILMEEARQVVFLGFGFHKQNMDLLRSEINKKRKHVYLTRLGLSESDFIVVNSLINQCFDSKVNIVVSENVDCGKLMSDIGRRISS